MIVTPMGRVHTKIKIISFFCIKNKKKILLRPSETTEGKTSGANIQTSGAITPGPYVVKKIRLTHHSLCGSFWLPRTQWSSPNSPYSPDFAPCDFSPIPKVQI